tara:strand:+ start:720 stop:1112 length:393 start_codon:yes stop_codon:yes gene_type:complete
MEKFKPEQLQFSDMAISHFSQMLEKELEKKLIRIGVRKAGCSGYEYFFEYEEHDRDDDTIIKYDDCTFLIDSQSFEFLKGSKVDYTEDGFNKGIQFYNPNATAVCGCGESFQIDSKKNSDPKNTSEIKKK